MDPRSKKIREDILKISQASGHGHIPTCFSVVELIQGVYDTMNHRCNDPKWQQRDIFILSKGHAALGLYCTLAHAGYFPIEDVYRFGAFHSKFGCHADRSKVPGVEASTGSLGHGIGIAVGVAMGFKIQKSKRRVYTLIGDGESNEGTVWESIMVAANQGLDNLTIIFDDNDSQTRCQPISNPLRRFEAFDCNAVEADGHNLDNLKKAFEVAPDGRPKVIVANTQKGYGCGSLVRDKFAWHRRSPNEDELKKLLEELNDANYR